MSSSQESVILSQRALTTVKYKRFKYSCNFTIRVTINTDWALTMVNDYPCVSGSNINGLILDVRGLRTWVLWGLPLP